VANGIPLKVRARLCAGLVALAVAALGAPLSVQADAAATTSQLVTGHRFEPTLVPKNRMSDFATAGSARQKRSGIGSKPGLAPSNGRTVARATSPTRSTGTAPSTLAVASGLYALQDPLVAGIDNPPDPSIAVLGSSQLTGFAYGLTMSSTTSFEDADMQGVVASEFFALPSSDDYFGVTVSASLYRGRFVAVLPSFDGPGASCVHGWLNVAVSTTSDPRKSWIRYRINIGDAWTDQIRVGVSDDKVILATNQWDLDSGQPECLANLYEGARLRVVDWADLIDGSTLTVRDLSVSPYTSYYNWQPATNVAVTASTASGTTAFVAGEKFVNGTWGHFVFATVTGSAKSGTATLARNEDMTTAGTVPQLFGPPATIAAFASGNGFQDERITSASYRSGRLWVAATTSCKLQADTDFRACARYILLNTTTTPATVLDDVDFVDLGRDTFMPFVGFSRDASAYFLMSGSSATAQSPIDEYAVYRGAGATISGGDPEFKIHAGPKVYADTYLGQSGGIAADPLDNRGVWSIYGADGIYPYYQMDTRLRGGLTGDPSGTFHLGLNTGWVNSPSQRAAFAPSSASPILRVRWSALPDTEATAGGPRLLNGQEAESTAVIQPLDANDPALGGQADPTHVINLYVQWQTQDGIWSTPVLQSYQVDAVQPVLNGSPRWSFTSGSVGSTAPLRISWSASDDASGLLRIGLFWQRSISGKLTQSLFYFPPTTTSYSTAATLGATYSAQVEVFDRAGNNNAVLYLPHTAISAVQSSSSLVFHGTWSTSTSSSYLGGSTKYATSLGSYVSYTFSGKAIAFVSTKAATRGKFEVYVDGIKTATIDLYSSSTHYRQVVYQTSWASYGSHTIKIRVLGTSGRPRVDFDGFLRAT
jgi:hypothetical protein